MRVSTTRRKWFQLHLLTAVVMMFTAALLMRMNLLPRASVTTLTCQIVDENGHDTMLTFRMRAVSRGWPWWTEATFTRVADDGGDFQGYTDFQTSNAIFKTVRTHFGNIDTPTPQREYDAALALSIVCAVAAVCELALRMRENRRLHSGMQHSLPSSLAVPKDNANSTADNADMSSQI